MITEYHRPTTISEAVELLRRDKPITLPLGGGSYLSRHTTGPCCVVDLQELGLNKIEVIGNMINIGACARLEDIAAHRDVPLALKQAIFQEASQNLRNMMTVAGALVVSDGRSPLATTMQALDCKLEWTDNEKNIELGSWLPLRGGGQPARLITSITFLLGTDLHYDQVSRTPADIPIVSVAVNRWKSGRVKVVVGGFGKSPVTAFDGTEPDGVEVAVKNALSDAQDDWASAAYRMDVGSLLAKRIIGS